MQNLTGEPINESVGNFFQTDLLKFARDRTLDVILKASKQIHPGISELEAKQIVQEIQSQMGAPKSWHPPQIRFGENTILPFNKKGIENPILQEEDIFFFDIGPIFGNHEGDVGRTFSVGEDLEMKRACVDVEEIWQEVRDHWKNFQCTGAELYAFATQSAQKRNWILSLEKANGHRIADFPHIARARGSIEHFLATPIANRWILEIQIRHPERMFGAFFEDLLN